MLLVLALWFEYVETASLDNLLHQTSARQDRKIIWSDPVLPVFCVIPKKGGTPILQILARVGGNKDQTH